LREADVNPKDPEAEQLIHAKTAALPSAPYLLTQAVGNVPLAAVLWSGGTSFGGFVAFLFADLIVLPIVNIYRKYYGPRVAMLLFVLFYAAMAGAGYVVELIFGVLGLVPGERRMQIAQLGVTWNYITVLNILALAVSAVLVWRFLRTGGPDMLRMMGSDGKSRQHDDHTRHHETR
jgi:uncharacterized membrane protein YraQ (UPF0718 family)